MQYVGDRYQASWGYSEPEFILAEEHRFYLSERNSKSMDYEKINEIENELLDTTGCVL